MQDNNAYIPGTKIKQVFLILLLTALTLLIASNLSMFIPSLLGAVTLYIVTRKFNLKLQEERGWKPWAASGLIILLTLVVLVLPIYFIADLVIAKLGNAQEYMAKFNVFVDKIHDYIYSKVNFDILSKNNMDGLKNWIGTKSTAVLSTTFNTLTIIMSMYFILYFMLASPRRFERIVTNALPLKRANINLIGQKFRKLVIANAVGIPVVAVGQGIVALVGYFIFGAPNPVLLFALTAVGSMLPIVGAGIVWVPVCIYMIAEGSIGQGLGLAAYCLVVVGLTDNLLRFTLLKKLENIHPLNTVFGIIMGMNLFGFMGLIFGPILVSITLLLFQVYKDEFSDSDTELILPNNDEPEEKINLML